MKKILAILLLAPIFALAGINQECPQFTVNGVPLYQAQLGDQEICHKNYAILHRCSVKAPIAVFEHVRPEMINGPHKRRDDFRPDLKVHPQCRAQLSDYAGNSYDRGHMAPAGNFTHSAEAMSESFFLSNIVPQVPNNNRGIWSQLETWERFWVLKGGDFYIISGGIYRPNHRVIGNGVGVPDYLYKVIIDRDTGIVTAYLMPNAAIPVADLPKYQTNMTTIEQYTGMRFNLGQ
jgi:endonuclease G, mitochondrial